MDVKCKDCIFNEKCNKDNIGLGDLVAKPISCSKGKSYEDLNRLQNLNSLLVVDYDADSDNTMIYIHINDTEENRTVLKEIGASEEDFKAMVEGLEDDDLLDITTFGFYNLNANYWSSSKGFEYSK